MDRDMLAEADLERRHAAELKRQGDVIVEQGRVIRRLRDALKERGATEKELHDLEHP